MSKTASRRHHTYRLINKYKKLQKHQYSISDEVLSFGRVFSKDPIDCSNPKCMVCRRGITKPRKNTVNLQADLELVDAFTSRFDSFYT